MTLLVNPCGCYLDDAGTWHHCPQHQDWRDDIMADLDARFGRWAVDRFARRTDA